MSAGKGKSGVNKTVDAASRKKGMALKPAARRLIRRCWHASPQWLRCAFLEALCRARAVPAQGVRADDDGPMYVCGAFRSLSGLAQGACLYLAARKREGRRVFGVDVGRAMRAGCETEGMADCLAIERARGLAGGGTVVIHANPPGFQLALAALGKGFLRGKRVVGYWAWEVEDLPSVWKQALAFVDAIETPSTFVADIMRAHTDKPVRVVPHQLPAPAPFVRLPFAGVLRCLFIFDAASGWERKNPMAALRAFEAAFPKGGATLTVHVMNSQANPHQFKIFCQACALVRGVSIRKNILNAQELEKLYLSHDIYISLHRSEGYGLTLAEAMQYGLHVVATGWSGNMDFMTGSLAHPVPYVLISDTMRKGPFKDVKIRWAEADVVQAAKILRCIASDMST